MIKGLPVGPRRQAFKAVVDAIQNSSGLANSRIVKSWRVWNGAGPTAPPTVDQMPCVRITMLGGTIERMATQDDSGLPGGGIPTVDVETHPTIIVETWVAGSDVGDAQDLGDLIDTALFPPDQPSRAKLWSKFLEVGITDWMPTREILPESLQDYEGSYIRSIGSFRISLGLTQ